MVIGNYNYMLSTKDNYIDYSYNNSF